MLSQRWTLPVARVAHGWRSEVRGVNKKFYPKVFVEVTKGKFQVKTVQNRRELFEAQRLRYEVFHKEYQGRRLPLGLDIDEFDAIADHLIIKETQTGRIVGTYRLISSSFSSSFYSQTEFEMDEFLSQPLRKLELGRACIHKDFRNGTVLNLLWRGISEYAKKTDAEILFGCTSLKTTSTAQVMGVLDYLAQNSAHERRFGIRPVLGYELAPLRVVNGSADFVMPTDQEIKQIIPPLLESYLKMGGKVFGLPAFDREFNCVDFLTVLDLRKMDARYERRFLA